MSQVSFPILLDLDALQVHHCSLPICTLASQGWMWWSLRKLNVLWLADRPTCIVSWESRRRSGSKIQKSDLAMLQVFWVDSNNRQVIASHAHKRESYIVPPISCAKTSYILPMIYWIMSNHQVLVKWTLPHLHVRLCHWPKQERLLWKCRCRGHSQTSKASSLAFVHLLSIHEKVIACR